MGQYLDMFLKKILKSLNRAVSIVAIATYHTVFPIASSASLTEESRNRTYGDLSVDMAGEQSPRQGMCCLNPAGIDECLAAGMWAC
jgi:hypothetical protein